MPTEPIHILGLIGALAGLAIFLSVFVKFPNNPIKNPFAAFMIGGLVMVGSVVVADLPSMFESDAADDGGETQQIIYQTQDTTAQYPEFDITPGVDTTSGTYNEDTTLNTGKTMFTIPARACTTGHTIIHLDNTTAWADPRLTFGVIPVPFAGADADDLATICFEVENYDAYIDIDDAVNQRLITKSTGDYQVIWRQDSTVWYVEGEKTMLMTENISLTLDFDVNQVGFSYMDLNDPVELKVKFSNKDNTWSKSYTASFEVQIQHVVGT
jgi:hypothetical protein